MCQLYLSKVGKKSKKTKQNGTSAVCLSFSPSKQAEMLGSVNRRAETPRSVMRTVRVMQCVQGHSRAQIRTGPGSCCLPAGGPFPLHPRPSDVSESSLLATRRVSSETFKDVRIGRGLRENQPRPCEALGFVQGWG